MRHKKMRNMKNSLKSLVFVLDLCQVLMYIKYIAIRVSTVIGMRMIVEIIRGHIRTCGKSRYRISQDTGIDEAALCRIMQGGGCYSDTADKLCDYFGLELVQKKRKKKVR